LLAVTNRPIWSDTPLLGMLFIVSAASTSAALLMLLAHRYGWRALPGVAALERMDNIVLVLEILVIIAVAISLGPAVRGWLNVWGILLLAVVAVGMIAPLVLSLRQGHLRRGIATSAVLVLVGGFLLRFVVIFSSEMIRDETPAHDRVRLCGARGLHEPRSPASARRRSRRRRRQSSSAGDDARRLPAILRNAGSDRRRRAPAGSLG